MTSQRQTSYKRSLAGRGYLVYYMLTVMILGRRGGADQDVFVGCAGAGRHAGVAYADHGAGAGATA
jgi:hypothetical protein